MSQPGLHKLHRIAYYLMTENVQQREMQSRYDACRIVDRIIKEIKLGIAIKDQKKGSKRK